MENKKYIILGIIFIIALTTLLVFGKSSDKNSETFGASGEIKEFNIIAKQWSFEPSSIEVNAGDKVILHVESIDVSHGIVISDFNVNEYLAPGKNVDIEFIADKKGKFSFFCSVPCGMGHGRMNGELIVK